VLWSEKRRREVLNVARIKEAQEKILLKVERQNVIQWYYNVRNGIVLLKTWYLLHNFVVLKVAMDCFIVQDIVIMS
jgi:hypothetical protein